MQLPISRSPLSSTFCRAFPFIHTFTRYTNYIRSTVSLIEDGRRWIAADCSLPSIFVHSYLLPFILCHSCESSVTVCSPCLPTLDPHFCSRALNGLESLHWLKLAVTERQIHSHSTFRPRGSLTQTLTLTTIELSQTALNNTAFSIPEQKESWVRLSEGY